jgi:hypothetical protein
MKFTSSIGSLFCSFIVASSLNAQQVSSFNDNFSDAQQPLKITGRGVCKIEDGVLKSKDAYVCLGNPDWKNYSVTFKARVSEDAEQVQIWAGFRAFNRFDRYIVGFRAVCRIISI